MELGILQGDDGELVHSRFKRHAVYVYVRPVEIKNDNIFNDLQGYEVEYANGMT